METLILFLTSFFTSNSFLFHAIRVGCVILGFYLFFEYYRNQDQKKMDREWFDLDEAREQYMRQKEREVTLLTRGANLSVDQLFQRDDFSKEEKLFLLVKKFGLIRENAVKVLEEGLKAQAEAVAQENSLDPWARRGRKVEIRIDEWSLFTDEENEAINTADPQVKAMIKQVFEYWSIGMFTEASQLLFNMDTLSQPSPLLKTILVKLITLTYFRQGEAHLKSFMKDRAIQSWSKTLEACGIQDEGFISADTIKEKNKQVFSRLEPSVQELVLTTHYQLASIYDKKGDIGEARKIFKRLNELTPLQKEKLL